MPYIEKKVYMGDVNNIWTVLVCSYTLSFFNSHTILKTKNVSRQLRPNIPSHNDEITDDVQTQEQKQT